MRRLGLQKGTLLVLPLHICNVLAAYLIGGAFDGVATAVRPAALPLLVLLAVHYVGLREWVG